LLISVGAVAALFTSLTSRVAVLTSLYLLPYQVYGDSSSSKLIRDGAQGEGAEVLKAYTRKLIRS
jgi:hypothetical protein